MSAPDPNLRAFWDRQMAFRQILPDFQACLVRMEHDSKQFAALRQFARLTTGTHPRQWVEWTEGRGDPAILPVIIHGGYWRALEAQHHRFLMGNFLDHGAHIANIEYRLMPEFRLADCVRDVKAGLKALMEQFPNSSLLLIGHSAGAHLAVCAASDQSLARQIHGVIALSGVYDLRPVALSSIQDEVGLTDAEIAQFSLPPSDDRPAIAYVNGADETEEFLRGSALMAASGSARWHVLPDAHHLTLLWRIADHIDELMWF